MSQLMTQQATSPSIDDASKKCIEAGGAHDSIDNKRKKDEEQGKADR
jgi:hypothetical protein